MFIYMWKKNWAWSEKRNFTNMSCRCAQSVWMAALRIVQNSMKHDILHVRCVKALRVLHKHQRTSVPSPAGTRGHVMLCLCIIQGRKLKEIFSEFRDSGFPCERGWDVWTQWKRATGTLWRRCCLSDVWLIIIVLISSSFNTQLKSRVKN